MIPHWVLCIIFSLGFAVVGIGCGGGADEGAEPDDPEEGVLDPAEEREMIQKNSNPNIR